MNIDSIRAEVFARKPRFAQLVNTWGERSLVDYYTQDFAVGLPSPDILSAIEEDELTRLPASVFVRGFVIQYAKALKVDHEKVANSYMAFFRSKRPG